MDKTILRDIHRFWFGELPYRDSFREEKIAMWFTQSDETDRLIRERFGAAIPEAAATAWDVGGLSRRDAVALVVLLDQFPRNIFRESGEAFAYDAKARQIAEEVLAATGPERFFWIEQAAIGLPFEHSEDIADQDFAVMFFARLAVSGPDRFRKLFRDQLDYATKHRDIIRRFGRFPHRNAVLGREPTPEEVRWPSSPKKDGAISPDPFRLPQVPGVDMTTG